MADFSTGAELTLEVSDSSLRDAKNTIESELGNLEVDVNAIVSGGGGGRQPRDPSSGRFMAMEGVEQRVVNSNEHLEDILTVLLDMDDKLGGGGGGGSTNVLAGGVGTGAASGIGTALGGLVLSGAISKGARNWLMGGGMGQTGRQVVQDRKITLEAWTQNPGEAMANGFKNMLDPTGVGETIATSTAQGIMDSTTFDEEVAAGFETGLQQWEQFEFPQPPDIGLEVPSWLQRWIQGPPVTGQQTNASMGGNGQQAFTPSSGGPARAPQVKVNGSPNVQVDVVQETQDLLDEVERKYIDPLRRDIENALRDSGLV